MVVGCSGLGQCYHNGFKVGPNDCAPTADVAESWIEANDPHLLGGEHDNACWWTAFGDPTLDQLIAQASQQNLTLKIAGCRILEARAERGIAEGNLFPQQQEMTAQYSRNAMRKAYQPLLDSERALVQQQDVLAESRGSVGTNLRHQDVASLEKALVACEGIDPWTAERAADWWRGHGEAATLPSAVETRERDERIQPAGRRLAGGEHGAIGCRNEAASILSN